MLSFESMSWLFFSAKFLDVFNVPEININTALTKYKAVDIMVSRNDHMIGKSSSVNDFSAAGSSELMIFIVLVMCASAYMLDRNNMAAVTRPAITLNVVWLDL